ncbi:GMC oxidoreductase [Nocardioides sp. R-C-SC26]|uniref:GMC oxidoreductase n=1 Tax=Nocardioides sp. R-C-SC26 TaxID=2870414 RepID=UPI001E3D5015|nr:GMC oxidoreductase [Nocardioides sp. R-C-SC26]
MGDTISTEDPDHVDWIVVGSGFGGSVSALRLAEKGYRVVVVEQGRRWADGDFARTSWQLRRFLWAPRMGLRGIVRMTTLQHLSIVSGVGVGGGSLAYANVLYRPDDVAFADPAWPAGVDWARELAPHYDEAERMLGVAAYDPADPANPVDPAAGALADAGRDLGAEAMTPARIGVFLGTPGRTVPDPYFGGHGPERTGCTRCGDCLLGCRVGAKNTLVKNYLWWAERRGVRVLAEHEVVDVAPRTPGSDGTAGYRVTLRTGRARRVRRELTCDGVVVAGGVLGTVELLHRLRAGALPGLSPRIGDQVRTNGEHVPALLMPRGGSPVGSRPSITSSIHLDSSEGRGHVETLVYGRHATVFGAGLTVMAPQGPTGRTRRGWARTVLRHPLRALRVAVPFGAAARQVVVLHMRTGGGALRLRLGRRGLVSEQSRTDPVPTSSVLADDVTTRMAAAVGGIAETPVLEALRGIGTTAHPLGGAVVAVGPDDGVVDPEHRAFGYRNLLVCDGSVVPANLGTNPSLTIAAMTERAMSRVPPRSGP